VFISKTNIAVTRSDLARDDCELLIMNKQDGTVYPSTVSERLKKTMEILSQDSRSPDLDSNPSRSFQGDSLSMWILVSSADTVRKLACCRHFRRPYCLYHQGWSEECLEVSALMIQAVWSSETSATNQLLRGSSIQKEVQHQYRSKNVIHYIPKFSK
jgi:hypothetical protein